MTGLEEHMATVCNGIVFEIYEYSRAKTSLNGYKIFPIINYGLTEYIGKNNLRRYKDIDLTIITHLGNKVRVTKHNSLNDQAIFIE